MKFTFGKPANRGIVMKAKELPAGTIVRRADGWYQKIGGEWKHLPNYTHASTKVDPAKELDHELNKLNIEGWADADEETKNQVKDETLEDIHALFHHGDNKKYWREWKKTYGEAPDADHVAMVEAVVAKMRAEAKHVPVEVKPSLSAEPKPVSRGITAAHKPFAPPPSEPTPIATRGIAEPPAPKPVRGLPETSVIPTQKTFKYGMRLRPAGVGAVKPGYISYNPDEKMEDKDAMIRHGVVEYDHELTDEEVKKWELVPIHNENYLNKIVDELLRNKYLDVYLQPENKHALDAKFDDIFSKYPVHPVERKKVIAMFMERTKGNDK
jgi:hypothetical protein